VRAVYLDYNATTPPDPGVMDVVRTAALRFGNPSSLHAPARAARTILDEARQRLATLWRCRPTDVAFTASATEANNLAILGVARARRNVGRHLVLSAVEHPAVLRPAQFLAANEGCTVSLVVPDMHGRVDPAAVEEALRKDTILVSVIAAHNETGTLQPVQAIGALCRLRGIPFHTDAVQWYGKEPFQTPDQFCADLVTISAHKFHGPRGAAALYIRAGLSIQPLILGGPQENERRAGTENLPAIVGLAYAVENFAARPVFNRDKLDPLRLALRRTTAEIPGATLYGHPTACLCNTVAASFAGCDTLSLVASLDLEGIYVSGGSACASGALEPPAVLNPAAATGQPGHGLIRFSLGRENTAAQVQAVAAALPGIVRRIREVEQPANRL
jgi:cysteine desulfurase